VRRRFHRQSGSVRPAASVPAWVAVREYLRSVDVESSGDHDRLAVAVLPINGRGDRRARGKNRAFVAAADLVTTSAADAVVRRRCRAVFCRHPPADRWHRRLCLQARSLRGRRRPRRETADQRRDRHEPCPRRSLREHVERTIRSPPVVGNSNRSSCMPELTCPCRTPAIQISHLTTGQVLRREEVARRMGSWSPRDMCCAATLTERRFRCARLGQDSAIQEAW
jgi:hypothetical protein